MSDELESLRRQYRICIHNLNESRTKSDRNRWLDTISEIQKEIHDLESIEV